MNIFPRVFGERLLTAIGFNGVTTKDKTIEIFSIFLLVIKRWEIKKRPSQRAD